MHDVPLDDAALLGVRRERLRDAVGDAIDAEHALGVGGVAGAAEERGELLQLRGAARRDAADLHRRGVRRAVGRARLGALRALGGGGALALRRVLDLVDDVAIEGLPHPVGELAPALLAHLLLELQTPISAIRLRILSGEPRSRMLAP